jgi:hypothetical protein
MTKYNIRFFRSEEIYVECLNLSKKQIKTKLEQELVTHPYLYFFHKQKIELSYPTNVYKAINNSIEMMLDIKGRIFHSMNDIDPLYSDFEEDDKLYNKVCTSLFRSPHLNYFNKKGDMIELKFKSFSKSEHFSKSESSGAGSEFSKSEDLGSEFSLVYYIDWSFLNLKKF